MVLIWGFRAVHPDLALNLFSELLGVAFTLFIIDTLGLEVQGESR